MKLTTYSGGVQEFMDTPLQSFIEEVESGRTRLRVGPAFQMDDIVEAHRCLEENRASGKIVVLT